ncbi:TonB-dependent receptor plug [Melioribacter roseus P3M-2]|uniref:TonB-dependent receptor plug n=1 Tax=Melioribacter roseus (strain DSM 23840 / JCM 17771 / VKM B-2668 / P3M-2) TaxID=1191523 RepID=I6YTC7_MELRP|nr:TonB-dependent receptor [Melioribacter roseus]AFN73802.1 TonB-dependent receptor plug [Melioribacter roseus P3M-2]
MKKLILILLIFSGAILAQSGRITGRVIDKDTKEPLPGVNIILIGTNKGAASDIDGYFEINNLEPGRYQIKASSIGYEPLIKSEIIVTNVRPADLLIELKQKLIEIESVTVSSGYFNTDPYELNSTANFSYEEIRRAPGGFEDVIRALSVLPGIAQASPGRNDLVVRGGAPSENLYLVNGYPVQNINHFGSQGATGGPLSYVNLDFVRETNFSTGGFSVAYGDKISSVLRIDLREGRSDRIGGKATISATQFGLDLEGPVSENSSFIISARRSYLDFIFDAAGFNFVPEYYDALAKYDHKIDAQNSLSFLFIGAFDKVKYNNNNSDDIYENSRILGSNQNQYLTGLSYRHIYEKGFYDISLSRNFFDNNASQRDTNFNPIFLNNSIEGENTLKFDAVYKVSSKSEINFGAEVKSVKFKTDIFFPPFVTSYGDTLNVGSVNMNERYGKYAAYVQYSATAGMFLFSAGLRADYYGFLNSGFYLSPRFSVSYMLDPSQIVSLSAGVYYQSPSYIWLAGSEENKNLKAIRANQLIAGYELKLREDTRLRAEAYYKLYGDYPVSQLRPYLILTNTGAGFSGSTDNFSSYALEPLRSAGKGFARGVEVSVQKKSSDIPHYGILSLTWNESYFTALDGVERPGKYDQKWIINLSGGYIFTPTFEGSLKFRFATGNPYTPFEPDGSQLVEKYNSLRFKPFHSLDLRFDKRWHFENFALITYLDIQNIYNNKASNEIRWDDRKKEVDAQSSIGILPSIGISLEF